MEKEKKQSRQIWERNKLSQETKGKLMDKYRQNIV